LSLIILIILILKMAASKQSRKHWEIERRLNSWDDAQLDSEDDHEVVLKQLEPNVVSNHERALKSLVEFCQPKKLDVPSFEQAFCVRTE
jgi:hypothetical protein